MRGTHPGAARVAAMERGVRAMGDPAVSVVLTDDFDGTVRSITGSQTYSSDRGTGTVGAKTIDTPQGSVVVVNGIALQDVDDFLLERLLAHESGHALMHARGERVKEYRHLAATQWQWYLLCIAAYAIEEARIERRVGELGYPPSGSTSPDHLADVLHATNVDLHILLTDPKSENVERLRDGVLGVLDRLTKVLAYVAADVICSDRVLDLAGEGPSAQAYWDDYVAPTWGQRLDLYAGLPRATEEADVVTSTTFLAAGLSLETSLLRDVGFVFESYHNGYGFHRRVSDAVCVARYERALAQARFYEEQAGEGR